MDFKELYEKAQKNAKKQEKKVREAAFEMETRKRKQEQQMAIERSREKFDIKRRILQNKPEIKNLNEQKKDFVIQKKDPHPSEINIRSFNKQNVEKNLNNLNIKKSTSQLKNDDKVNSSKQVNQTKLPIKNSKPLQKISNAQNFDVLLKQAERNDAKTVENLFNEVESSSSLNNKLLFNKQKKVLVSEELGVTAGLNLSHFAAREKQKEIKQKNKIESKMTENTSLDPLKISKTNKINTKIPSQNQKLINSQFSTTKNNLQSSKNTNSIQKKLSSLPKNCQEKQELTKANTQIINKTITKKNNNKVRISLPSKTFSNKITINNTSINSQPDSSTQNPQRKYLPGDIRYQEPNQNNKNNSIQQKQVISFPKKSVSIPSTEKIQQKIEKQKITISNVSSNKKINNNNNITPFVQKHQLNTNKNRQFLEKNNKIIKTPLQSNKQKEMCFNNKIIKREEKPLIKSNGISLEHIKKEAVNRHQILQNIRKGNSSSSLSNNNNKKAMRYANYSETDDDEDDEYEGGRYGDEYESDLSDFIDDSMVDDLQREDLEETLRLINPRYDKQKWLIRERMIDDRRMDAKFKDVELEERRSAKYGLVEDLIEAKRGSKALA